MYLNKLNTTLALAFIFACLSSCKPGPKPAEEPVAVQEQPLPYYKSADYEPYWYGSPAEAARNTTHRLGMFAFIDQEHDTVTEKTVKGKIHVANFFFTSCGGICPVMAGEFERLQTEFESDENIVLLSFSVDPERDNVNALKNYATEHQAIQNKWHLMTGQKEALYTLARTFYFAEKTESLNKDSNEFLHTENFVLVDRQGYIRGIYSGTLPQETDRLVKDIKKLEKES